MRFKGIDSMPLSLPVQEIKTPFCRYGDCLEVLSPNNSPYKVDQIEEIFPKSITITVGWIIQLILMLRDLRQRLTYMTFLN